jgi:hypothetical protein
VASGPLPDKNCTPGGVMTNDVDVICDQPTGLRRHVSVAEHRHVFERYGISYPQPEGAYEVDHLIPLELGGSNDPTNLWPEAAEPRPGFHEKDEVENYLHEQVCRGAISLVQAQRQVADSWLVVYYEQLAHRR